jgi:hypothetical protein
MAWALVKRLFKKHPLVANCAVYGTLYVGAEFSQQTINKKFLVYTSYWVTLSVFIILTKVDDSTVRHVCRVFQNLSLFYVPFLNF